MLHYSGPTAQTITNNISVTAPEGITTALRFTYGPSASNPGLNIMSPISASTTYTMSAYVMIESLTSTPGGGGFAENGVVSGTALDNAQVGVWQKITWTRTTTASPGPNFGIRFAAVGGTGTGSILVTGIMIEAVDAANASPTFFDGATAASGDFSYAWTSTANASVSWMRAPSIGGWAATSTGIAYQSGTSPMHGTKCGAVLTKGFNGDGLYHNNITVTAGLTYTVSIWIKLTSVVPSMNVLLRWKDSNETILKDDFLNIQGSLVVGQWVRVSATFTAVSGATRLQPMVRANATHTPTTFYVDSLMVEQNTVMTGYFDGSTSSVGDFTYLWGGTVGQSISNERVFNVPAAIAGKSTGVGFENSKFWVYAATAEDGSKTCKWVAPAGTPSSNWRLAGITGNSQYGFPGTQLKAGGQYTLWIRYRAYGWGSTQTFQVQVADQTGQNIVAAYDTSRLINTTGWTEYRRTFTALRDGTPATTVYASLPLVPQTATDGVFEFREWMLVEGDYRGDFIDGTKPFSKWEGTVNGSTSIGYPPQLLDLAGKPEYDLTTSTVGGYTLPGGFGDAEARTIYTVYSNLADITDSSVPLLLTYGSTALNDVVPNTFITMRQQTFAGPSNALLARRTGGAGSLTAGSMVGNNVAVWGLNTSGFIFNSLNNGSVVTDSQVMTLPHERISISAPTAWGVHIRTIIYRGYHDAVTRAAVSRYLGNKYGAKVA